jgi:hypothetical protein
MKIYLTIAILTVILSCDGQTRKELLLSNKNLTEGTLPDFIEKYLIEQQKKKDKEGIPKVTIEENEKQIDIDQQVGGEIYSIPRKRDEFIKGDLTEDKKPEIIINVVHSFGASGHNIISFLFIGNSKGYSFVKTFDCSNLAQCKAGGAKWGELQIEEIKNNMLFGTSLCYTEDDAACCPSKQFSSTFKYDSKSTELVLINQILKK